MNNAEHELVAYLTDIKDRKIGFMDLKTDVPGWCIDIHLDARYDMLASECIFDDCTDAQSLLFLESFLAGELSVSWAVSEQLSKLLSKRGHLVSATMDRLLTTRDWSSIGNYLLFLSYLALRKDGADLAARLLDEVPEDGRDALFLACYKLESQMLDRKLMKKFAEWEAEGWTPGSTGELADLEQFIAKWLKLYPYSELEGVIRIYFIHRAVD